MQVFLILCGNMIRRFLTKKLMAAVAVDILERIVRSTENTVDDATIKPIVAAIKKEYNIGT